MGKKRTDAHTKPAKTVPLEDHERLQQWYAEELARKDKMIDELRIQNVLLIKSALRQSERSAEFSDIATGYKRQAERDARTEEDP